MKSQLREVVVAPSGRVDATHALAEDRATVWVADPLGDADFMSGAIQGRLPRSRPAAMRVPRPTGKPLLVADVPIEALLELKRLCDPFRERVDELLDPGVYGYRRGASAGSDYARDYADFQQASEAIRPGLPWVARCDVEDFFKSITPGRVAEALSWAGVDAAPVTAWCRRMASSQAMSLPPGYADTRMLGHLVLAQAESTLGSNFVRWVDDYRLHTNDPQVAVDQLAEALGTVGLRLNAAKTEFVRAGSQERAMLSVFQAAATPGPDGLHALRNMVGFAFRDPIARRRELRYALPRLGDRGDTAFVSQAMLGLDTTPWDAPRIVDYLGKLPVDAVPIRELAALSRTAVKTQDAWLLGRILPLWFVRRTPSELLSAVEDHLSSYRGSIWGLAVRLLAQQGGANTRRAVVKACQGSAVPSARAALGALADMDQSLNVAAAVDAPETAEFLLQGPAPLPASASWL